MDDLILNNHCWHYVKDSKGKRTGSTVCILVRGGRIFIGEAVLAPGDQFCKRTGRLLSFDRANESYQAWIKKQSEKVKK